MTTVTSIDAARIARRSAAPSPTHTLATACQFSLHVDAIARELFAASLVAAGLPRDAATWELVTQQTRETFRENATVAILQMQPGVNAVARAHVRLYDGERADQAIDTYRRELLKHAPTTR